MKQMSNPWKLLLLNALLFGTVFYHISAENSRSRRQVSDESNEHEKIKTSQLVNENLHKSSLLKNGLLTNLRTIENQLKHALNRKRRDADNDSLDVTRTERNLFETAGEALRQSIARAYQLWNTVKSRVRKTIDSITGNN